MANEMATMERTNAPAALRGGAMRTAEVYRPATDIFETDDHVVLVADMPGVAPENVEVSLERRILTVRGHLAPDEHQGYRRVHAEYDEGDFERAFTLSEDIDRERIEAIHKNGVLTLKLPKAEPAKARRIEVKSD